MMWYYGFAVESYTRVWNNGFVIESYTQNAVDPEEDEVQTNLSEVWV